MHLVYNLAMSIAHRIHRTFSKYANKNEREIAKFFSVLDENMHAASIKAKIVHFIQKDIIAVNLWSEYKYRQYKYLSKSHRRRLYDNCQKIVQDFRRYQAEFTERKPEIVQELRKNGIAEELIQKYQEEIMYLSAIMHYLSPHAGRYIYRTSSTFGALLKDPAKEKMVGDCNQIVTLYIYLYSLKFDVSTLQIKLIPGHVALHFNGIDIEATTGRFMLYEGTENIVLPIEEIVSVNLLDKSDDYFKTHKVPAVAFLESSRIAYLISSQRDIVEKNIKIAYQNVIVDFVNNDSYTRAIKYAKTSKELDLVEYVSENAVAYYLGKKQFDRALTFASYSKNKSTLESTILQNHGAYYYQKNDYKNALSIYEKINDSKSVMACYGALARESLSKLGDKITSDSFKNNKKIIQSAAVYAKKSGEKELIQYVEKLKSYL